MAETSTDEYQRLPTRLKEPESVTAERKRAQQEIPERRIWLPVAGTFVLLCISVWLNEIVDLPHLLLGAPHTPTNWHEAIIEMVLIASVGLFTVLRLIRDIAERKRAEEKLEAAHAFQQAIIDGVAEPIMVIGLDYQVELMNGAAREFASGSAGASGSLLCHQIYYERETPCDGIETPCPLEQVRQSGRPVTVVHEHCQANTVRRLVEVIASPWWGAGGTFQGIIESIHDITEHKRTEEALQQYAERLRSLTAQLAEVAEAERQRLARELHDQVGQNLTALGINLNIVRTQMPEGAAAPLRSRLEDSLSLVEQTAERTRDVMANLRPPALDDYGLVAALRWYGEQLARRTNTAIAVEGEEPIPRLAARVENALFRIAQEALINVAKHAQATRVAVTVEVDSRTLRLIVADDGIGFDPAHLPEPDGSRGWGLLTMTERAEAVGGHCRIESYPRQGTQVTVEVDR
jgi:signal transduction histidine kinase